MKSTTLLHCLTTTLILATAPALRAADEPAPAAPPGRPSREELRDQFKGLTPEERQVKMKEMREKAAPGGLTGEAFQQKRVEFEKFRDSVKDLPPAERETKLREWREKNLPAPSGPTAMTTEERETRRKEFTKRIEEQIAALKEKKAKGTLNDEETRRLERMEEMSKRLETRGTNSGPGLPVPKPAGDKPTAPPAAPVKPAKPADVK